MLVVAYTPIKDVYTPLGFLQDFSLFQKYPSTKEFLYPGPRSTYTS